MAVGFLMAGNFEVRSIPIEDALDVDTAGVAFLWPTDTNCWDNVTTAGWLLPNWLTSRALDRFAVMPARFTGQVRRNLPPTLARMFEYLDTKMWLYRDQRTARAYFKAIKQDDTEITLESLRPVRAVGDIGHTHLNNVCQEYMKKEHLISCFIIFRGHPRTIDGTLNRVLSPEAIIKGHNFVIKKHYRQ